jgi:charged multivesicular body protein 6
MEDTADAKAYQNEISELLSGKLTSEDEEEILAELAQIEKERLVEELPSIPVQEPVSNNIEEPLTQQQNVKAKKPQRENRKLEAALEAA